MRESRENHFILGCSVCFGLQFLPAEDKLRVCRIKISSHASIGNSNMFIPKTRFGVLLFKGRHGKQFIGFKFGWSYFGWVTFLVQIWVWIKQFHFRLLSIDGYVYGYVYGSFESGLVIGWF